MVELHIKIRKRIARLAYGENFVSYNEGYKIIFDFDKEWDSIENKTARFIFGENYIDYPFNGSEVEIPLIKNADTLEIGVYSDNLYTTTPVKFKVLKSIKDEEKIEILVPEIYPEIKELDDEDLIKVYDKSEEKIGISPLKKLFDRMKVAIDEALAAAKESGEFDGITPTIGDNGNWYLGRTDTGKPSRGEKGDKGDTGAQGIQGEKGEKGATGAKGKSAYSYAQDGGYTGTETEFAAKLAAEKLPNPYPLTFTGAVSETYDGSSAKTITIPSGGGLGNFELIGTVDFSQEGMAAANAGVDFEVSDVSEIVLVYNDLVNSTSSNSSVWVSLKKSSEQIESTLRPDSGKSGTPLNGWVFIKPLPGVGLTGIQSSSAISAINYSLSSAKTLYNMIPLASDFKITEISIYNPPTQYYAVGGTVKVYVR